jgi:type IV pilus assembly protein PilA
MKSELKAKFLNHLLANKKGNEGFTLIELLVVIIIIGILAAIALPSFLSQTAKARQSEGKTYVGSINRGQQAYYLENQAFAAKITDLELALSDSKNFSYITSGAKAGDTNTTVTATPKTDSVKGYFGIVYLDGQNAKGGICEATTPGAAKVPSASAPAAGAALTCTNGALL